MDIQLNKIDLKKIEVFKPNGDLLGIANQLELLDFRIRVCENKLEGYYVNNFEGKKLNY